MKNLIKRTLITIFILFGFSASAYSQTIYKKDPGFFLSPVESFYLRGGSFEETQLIGPAFGYRLNKNYDVTLHTEFLSSEIKFMSGRRPRLTLLNLGIIAGRTTNLAKRLMLRSEVSLYKSFNINLEDYNNLPDPALASAVVSSSLYWHLPVLKSISLLPNLGGFLGYGSYTPTLSTPDLRQGFDGFALGPQFGFDALFIPSDSFSLTASPNIRLYYTVDDKNFEGSLLLNILINL